MVYYCTDITVPRSLNFLRLWMVALCFSHCAPYIELLPSFVRYTHKSQLSVLLLNEEFLYLVRIYMKNYILKIM